MAEKSETTTVYCVHARSGKFECQSPWFHSREEAEAYPDKDWVERSIEEHRAIFVGGDLFLMSDIGMFNPDHEAAA